MALSPDERQALIDRARAQAASFRLAQAEKEQRSADSLAAAQRRISAEDAAPRSSLTALTAGTAALFAGANFKPMVAGMVYNTKQLAALETSIRGRSMCLIGAAGTGKTTTTKEIISQLVRLPHIQPISGSTRYLRKDSPGILIISFTNKAVNNIKKQLPEALQSHCLTIHKLLEYAPVRDLDGRVRGFAPTFNKSKPLPWISCLIFEESSMIGTDLYGEVIDALPPGCNPQQIFLGDLNQLPPVFGYSILGFKLLELPVVELDEVYRQALNSPIITLAHRVRTGAGFPSEWEFTDRHQCVVDKGSDGKVSLFGWNVATSPASGVKTMGHHFIRMIDEGTYDPEDDIILCPQNVGFGQIELNKYIAGHIGKKRNAVVWEVLARGEYHYLAVGDRVLYMQQECTITAIAANPAYGGRLTEDPSEAMDRWGRVDGTVKPQHQVAKTMQEAIDIFEATHVHSSTPQKNAASHEVTLQFLDTGLTVKISSSGDINSLLLGYVITVHKSQGSEWKRVIIALHKSHSPMLSRELMYTAITRARQELVIFFEPSRDGKMDSIKRAASSPEIKGITLEQKAEYFKGKKLEYKRKDFNQVGSAQKEIDV